MKTRLLFPIFLLLLLITNNIYALDTNTKKLSSSDPSTICSTNSGSLNTAYPIVEGSNNINYVDNFSYTFWKAWYKNDSNNNSDNYPYAMENLDTNSGVTIISNYTNNNDNTFTLNYKQFECTCPYGKDFYGLCKEELKESKSFTYSDPTQICSNNGKVEGATGELLGTASTLYTYNYDVATVTLHDRTFSRNSQNQNSINYMRKLHGASGGNNLDFYYNYSSEPVEIQYKQNFLMDRYGIKCHCPEGANGDEYGQCKPLNCTPPEVEIYPGTCGIPDFCPDGGQKISGSCDRSCESLGMITYHLPNDEFDVNNPNASKRCVDKFPCDNVVNSCVQKCGGVDKVKKSPICDDTLGVSGSCQCETTSNEDDILDETEPDDTTEPNDSLLTNKYLKAIKEANESTNDKLQNIDSLLTTSNNNDSIRENQLNSIDNSLQNMNNNISDMKDSVDGVNSAVTSLKSGQDEGNGLLNDIKNNTRDNADSSQGIFDKLDELFNVEPETIENEIGDNLSILDDVLNEYGTFKDNLTSQYESVVELGNSAKETINGGFISAFTNNTSEVTACKQSFLIDFSSIGASSFNIEIDPCYVTSMLRPIFYPMLYIVFSASVFLFALNLFIGVL